MARAPRSPQQADVGTKTRSAGRVLFSGRLRPRAALGGGARVAERA